VGCPLRCGMARRTLTSRGYEAAEARAEPSRWHSQMQVHTLPLRRSHRLDRHPKKELRPERCRSQTVQIPPPPKVRMLRTHPDPMPTPVHLVQIPVHYRRRCRSSLCWWRFRLPPAELPLLAAQRAAWPRALRVHRVRGPVRARRPSRPSRRGQNEEPSAPASSPVQTLLHLHQQHSHECALLPPPPKKPPRRRCRCCQMMLLRKKRGVRWAAGERGDETPSPQPDRHPHPDRPQTAAARSPPVSAPRLQPRHPLPLQPIVVSRPPVERKTIPLAQRRMSPFLPLLLRTGVRCMRVDRLPPHPHQCCEPVCHRQHHSARRVAEQTQHWSVRPIRYPPTRVQPEVVLLW